MNVEAATAAERMGLSPVTSEMKVAYAQGQEAFGRMSVNADPYEDYTSCSHMWNAGWMSKEIEWMNGQRCGWYR